ncbi:hypothetical protein BJY04DRAFT_213296 [Aspergillus karnatakaensis]|uniref:uncharacterized protein n=1 Tax=Aspergillus karnatakaensis TaxID=1810916 RepID=UPI003CCE448A
MTVTAFAEHPAEILPGQPQDLPGGYLEEHPPSFEPSSKDIFIAVMGMTGAGKSTFISHCTEEEVIISAPGALESCTQEVRVHRCNYFLPYANVYLVDTPGFDDTNRKDTDILKEIATWLTQTYQQKIRLTGILYLHRISDNRMGGCAQKNLVMFKRLCGPNGIKNIRFVTTFWEKTDDQDGERREQTLQTTEQFWGFFIERGAEVRRHMNTNESALWVLADFVPGYTESPPDETELAIQTEMVDSGKDLDQTAAGQELQSEFVKEREKMQAEMKEREEDMKEALAARDKEMFEFLRQEQDRQREELRRRDDQMQDLRVSMEKMHEEKIRQLQEVLQRQKEEQEKYQQEVDRIRSQFLTHIQETRAERSAEKNQYEASMANLTKKLDADRAAEKNRYENSIARLTQKIDAERSAKSQYESSLANLSSKLKAERSAEKSQYESSLANLTKSLAAERAAEKSQYERSIANLTQQIQDLQTKERAQAKARKTESQGYTSSTSKYAQKARNTCLTCGEYFSIRDDLFEHIEAYQHGRDLVTLKREHYTRPSSYRYNY